MIEFVPILDFEYLHYLIDNHPHTLDKKKAKENLDKYFLFGYTIYKEGIRLGSSFTLKVNNTYSMDGYNECGSVWDAVQGGKRIVNDLFDWYTDIVFTSHYVHEKAVTAVAKRIGFKKVRVIEGKVLLMRVEKWELRPQYYQH